MTGRISKCNVTVVTGPTDAQVDVVQNLQEVILKQLNVLELAYSSLKGPDTVTGIMISGSNNSRMDNLSIKGADIGLHIDESEIVHIENVEIEGK